MSSPILGLQQLLTASVLSNFLMRYLISQSVSQSNKIQFSLVNPRHRVIKSLRVFFGCQIYQTLTFLTNSDTP